MDDLDLIKQAEEALAEIDRNQGLSDPHAEVLAALRIRIHGGPKKTLDDVLKAAGEIKGKNIEDIEVPKTTSSLDDVLKAPPKKKDWPEL